MSTVPRRPLNALMVGAGSIAPFHAEGWRQNSDVQVGGVVARRPDRGQELIARAGLEGVRVFASLEDALGHGGWDFVDVLTPPAVHVEHVSAALDHGLSVFCQKPFTEDLAQAEALIQQAEACGQRIVVHDNWRWRGWYREIARLVTEGAIGAPRSASFHCHRDLVLPTADGSPPDLIARQPTTAGMDKLIVFEWGIHLIDVLRMVLGPITAVYATMSTTSPLVKGEDRAVIQLEHAHGTQSLVDISWATVVREGRHLVRGNVEPLLVEGDRGTIELDPFAGDLMYLTDVSGTQTRPAHAGATPAQAYQDSYTACQRHFSDCLLSGAPAENEARDNLLTLAAALAAYESASSGERVTLWPAG